MSAAGGAAAKGFGEGTCLAPWLLAHEERGSGVLGCAKQLGAIWGRSPMGTGMTMTSTSSAESAAVQHPPLTVLTTERCTDSDHAGRFLG